MVLKDLVVELKDDLLFCSVCDYEAYRGKSTLFFSPDQRISYKFMLFDGLPYYFCSTLCYDKFKLVPICAKPVETTRSALIPRTPSGFVNDEEAITLGFAR